MYARELVRPITELKGVGPRLADSFHRMEVFTWFDLISHLPRTYEDRQARKPFSSGYDGTPVLTVMEVIAHQYIRYRKGRALKVIVRDATGPAALLCFGRNFLQNILIPGKQFYFYGRGSVNYGELQFSSFETAPWTADEPPPPEFSHILPVYPLAGSLTQKIVRRAVAQLLRSSVRYLEDELPRYLADAHGLIAKRDALRLVHFPKSQEDIERSRRTLAFEELFYLHLIIRRRALKRSRLRRDPRSYSTALQKKMIKQLPFTLTSGQMRSLQEITSDLGRERPMARLIQGDVGSGKTLVALLASLPVIEAGRQAAFMVPTELLAKQHAVSSADHFESMGVRIALLHGGLKQSERQLLLASLKQGDIDMVIGTHALFSQDVEFKDLALVIIDEQHRFGVMQRNALHHKGEVPDMLLMTATPIPRTLAMTVFGDLDVSTIDTMPPGRKPVITHLASEASRSRVYQAVRSEFERGHQAYFVYPRIEQKEGSKLRDAESMFSYLSNEVFPGITGGLIHSQLPLETKESVMDAFRKGAVVYLAATSVIEVGVDVPNATCMVIEHAERFGLSALHQLRGRVGRGSGQAYAFLIYSQELTDSGKQRLQVMKQTSDGFVIAEEDMKIRGPGDLTGIQQSGFLRLSFSDLVEHLDILKETLSAVQTILSEDPGLLTPAHQVFLNVLEKAPPFQEELIDS